MISEERQDRLNILIDYIISKVEKQEDVHLNFICTHNSRRSHLAQIWAQIAAWEHNVENVHCFSGGTEATAMFPMIANTLSGQGLQIKKLSEEINPVYAIKSEFSQLPIIAFSKRYDHFYNPSENFAAVMTCSDADQNCPLIQGASARIPITYEDPKIFDGTDLAVAKYLERSEEIKEEMTFVFRKVRSRLP